MIRSVLLIALTIIMTGFATGQSWEDSLRIGKQYYQEKQYDKAYQTLLEAQKIAPSTIDLSQDIGNAAYRSQNYDMAEKAFRSATSKNDDQSQSAKNWHNVGNSQMKAKNYQAAIESYKESLRKDSQNDRTRYNLAEAQRRLKVQEEQQQNQENQDHSDQSEGEDESQNQQENNDQQDQNGKDNKSQQNQEGGNPNERDNAEPESKLSNRKTDRILEDLLKQEMETKKKIQGVETGENQEQVKSGKRW